MKKFFLFISTTTACLRHRERDYEDILRHKDGGSVYSVISKSIHAYYGFIFPEYDKETKTALLQVSNWILESEGKVLLNDNFCGCKCDTECEFPENELISCVSDATHYLADQLPSLGTYCLQVIWRADKSLPCPDDAMQLYAALLRLQVIHSARLYINIIDTKIEKSSQQCPYFAWKAVLPSVKLLEDKLSILLNPSVIWICDVILIGQQGENRARIPDVIITSQSGNSMFEKERNLYQYIQVDQNLELVCTVNHSSIPLHLVTTETFEISFFDNDDSLSKTFLDLCNRLEEKNVCFLGWLHFEGFDDRDIPPSYSTEEWVNYVETTNTISSDSFELSSRLKEHKTFILHCSLKDSRKLSLTFLRDIDAFDADAVIQFTSFVRNSSGVNSLPEISSPSEWPEKQAWINEEYKSKVKGSLVRFQSSEMTLAGIPVPSRDEGPDQKTVDEFTGCFDSTGNPANKDLKPIPLATDRLLKNICSEETVRELPFQEAKGFIAHGIEYCVDAHSSLKLDNRLTRIQTRYVGEDTRCTWHLPSREDKARKEGKTTKQSKQDKAGLKPISHIMTKLIAKEKKRKAARSEVSSEKSQEKGNSDTTVDFAQLSRSERHKRRLRLIVEAVVQKYGRVKKNDPCFENCVERLYTLSKSFLKDLKTSEGLTEEMKRVAKTNVNQVVEFELKRSQKKKT